MSHPDPGLCAGYQRSPLLSASALIFGEAPAPREHYVTFRDPRARPEEVWCLTEEASIPREAMGKPCPGRRPPR